MAKRNRNYSKEDILCDWKTGVYTQQQLADRYKVSTPLVNKIVKGTPKIIAELVEKRVALNRELEVLTPKEAALCTVLVNEKEADFAFYRGSSNFIANVAVEKGKLNGTNSSINELKMAQEVVGLGKANIYGKAPETAVQVNNFTGSVADALRNADRMKSE